MASLTLRIFKSNELSAIRAALDFGGVEVINGDAPGIGLWRRNLKKEG